MTVVFRDQQDRPLKLVLAALLLILLLLQLRLWSGDGSLADIDRLQREIILQQADNAELLERNELLRQEVSDLKTGVDSIEERARSELGLIRKGETFVLIVDKPGGAGLLDQAAPTPSADSGTPEQELAVDTLPPPPDELLPDTDLRDAAP